MKKAITLFSLLLTVLGSNAQITNITGVVNDNISKQPLPNATVVVNGTNQTNFKITIVTNSKGVYSFSVPIEGFYKMEVSYLGYTTQVKDSLNITTENKTISPFYLFLLQKDLAAVTVTGKKPFITMSADKITLNVAQSSIASGGNAYDVLKRAPGISEQSDNLTFRGKSINVLINGRPSNLSGEELKNILSNMQASTVEKVEILPNPSAKYDAQGGSVVNIILAKNKSFGTNYVLTTGVGTGRFASANTGLDINNRNKNINIFGGINYAYNKQYYDNKNERFLENGTLTSKEYDVRNRNNYTAKFGVDYDLNKKTSVGFLVNGFANYRNREVNDNSVLHYNSNLVDSTVNVNTIGNALFKRAVINTYYKIKFDSAGKELSINLDYINQSKKWNDDFLNKYYDNLGKEYLQPNLIRDNSPAKINIFSITADYVHPLKKGRIEIGIKTSYTKTDNDVLWENNNGLGWSKDEGKTNHFIYQEMVNAGYVNYITTFKKWELQSGLRLEQTNTIGNSLTQNQKTNKLYIDFFPNIALQYTKNEHTIFNLSYRKSIERYDFNIVNPFVIYQNQYSYSQGNPTINPAKSNSLSFTYSHGELYTAGIDAVYATKFLAIVFKKAANNTLIQTYDNLNTAISVMPYINVTKEAGSWSSNFYVAGGYVNFISDNIKGGKSNNETWTYIGSLENSFKFKKGLSAEISSSYTGPISYGIYYNKPQFTTDLGMTKLLFKNKVSLKISLSDIFNTSVYKYQINNLQAKVVGNNKAETRFLTVSFKYRFGNSKVKGSKDRSSKLGDIQSRLN